MSFYGELFRKKDEEDIWEELRQMLINPPSEQEIALKKQEEQTWIDSILNKVTYITFLVLYGIHLF